MEKVIDYLDLQGENCNDFVIVDLRESELFDFYHIENAINVPLDKVFTELKLESDKKYLFYCKNGEESSKVSQKLNGCGYDTYYLKGGYFAFLECLPPFDKGNSRAYQIEESIRKKFHRKIFSKFCKAINDYKLIQENDKIAVCISGGKDSMLLAKLFQELKRHNKFPFEVKFLVMNPGYNEENSKLIDYNAQMMNIPINVFSSNIFENVVNIEKSPCYICARMRRGYLYKFAKDMGCNKIALGHHYDDVIETILMGMLYGAQIQTMMPKLHSKNFDGMELIRPLYLVRERDIIQWREYNNLKFLQCACKFTEQNYADNCDVTASKRRRVKQLIEMLCQEDEEVDAHIFKSVENVNLSTIIEYKDKNNISHNFLDDYDE